MKKIYLIALMLVAGKASLGQITDNLDFSFVYGPGITFASIKDDNVAPSRQSLAADGNTYVDENGLKGRLIKLAAFYNFNDNWAFGTGFYFSQIRLNPRNDDGSYIGTSVYHVNYLNIPLMFRYRSNEVTDNLRIVGGLGATFDIRTKEEAIGSDYAHYMNFAQNRYDLDPDRGRNGNNKTMKLFSTFGFSILANVAVEYLIADHFFVMGGFSYQYRLNNLLNGRLQYNDAAKTPVTEYLSFKASTFTFDFGFGYRIP